MSAALRKAEMSDALMVLDWRNDPVTRENSFSADPISPDTHLKWFERKLSDEDCGLFVLTEGDENIGFIRVDITGKEGEISYMIAPGYRGRGYGRMIIKLVEDKVPERVEILKAYTLTGNVISGKCFAANGYSECECEGKNCYTKKLRE